MQEANLGIPGLSPFVGAVVPWYGGTVMPWYGSAVVPWYKPKAEGFKGFPFWGRGRPARDLCKSLLSRSRHDGGDAVATSPCGRTELRPSHLARDRRDAVALSKPPFTGWAGRVHKTLAKCAGARAASPAAAPRGGQAPNDVAFA